MFCHEMFIAFYINSVSRHMWVDFDDDCFPFSEGFFGGEGSSVFLSSASKKPPKLQNSISIGSTRPHKLLPLKILPCSNKSTFLSPTHLSNTINSLLTDTLKTDNSCWFLGAIFQSFYYNLTLYKTDTSLWRTLVNGPGLTHSAAA